MDDEWFEKYVVSTAVFVGGGILAFGIILLSEYLRPDLIPFGLFDFWKNNRIWEGLRACWPIFLWGGGTSLISGFIYRATGREAGGKSFLARIFTSFSAGLIEEVLFRWVFFYAQIVIICATNYLIFGWLGWEPVKWLYTHISFPIVSFLTLHRMDWLIYSSWGWLAGAAAISANDNFRKGHRYLGWLGMINAWYLGFFFIWITFSFGIIPAIIGHAVYDVIVECVFFAIQKE